jgi:hypothetical protein
MAYRGAVLLCILLVFLTGFIAVTHFHPNELTPDRSCSLCALAHAGVAVSNVSAPAPVFTPTVFAGRPAIVPHSVLVVFSQYIRPPPQA